MPSYVIIAHACHGQNGELHIGVGAHRVPHCTVAVGECRRLLLLSTISVHTIATQKAARDPCGAGMSAFAQRTATTPTGLPVVWSQQRWTTGQLDSGQTRISLSQRRLACLLKYV
jgi:hypothetical protein